MRVWHFILVMQLVQVRFQLTHPWGCDIIRNLLFKIADISTHTPVRVWLTRAKFIRQKTYIISTHTPVRVWRQQVLQTVALNGISTHTPVRVWRWYTVLLWMPLQFQLTHPWGCDNTINQCANKCVYFNSHTREGVTSLECCIYGISQFQLTHPWGCDHAGSIWHRVYQFQLTHPWGCDNEFLSVLFYPFYFNSHTREGVTYSVCTVSPRYVISTHTPVRVWRWHCLFLIVFVIFQLTHPWGCDWRGWEVQ